MLLFVYNKNILIGSLNLFTSHPAEVVHVVQTVESLLLHDQVLQRGIKQDPQVNATT